MGGDMGSNPIASLWVISSVGRTLALHAGCPGFESQMYPLSYNKEVENAYNDGNRLKAGSLPGFLSRMVELKLWPTLGDSLSLCGIHIVAYYLSFPN